METKIKNWTTACETLILTELTAAPTIAGGQRLRDLLDLRSKLIAYLYEYTSKVN